MPIRINLKEIFSSDPQEINVEKVNFNFNKLLELGIGTPGPIGSTGPQGPAGPIGLQGPQGSRGATWWVDQGDPTQHVFPPNSLIDGDLYLDSTGFETWQYDLVSNTWTLVASISTAVTSYLSVNGASPFSKDFGSNSSESRFIVFRDRKLTTPPETGRAQSNVKTNILFLSNFDETQITGFPSDPTEYFTSLNNIYVDHDVATYDTSRYHIELGSKYSESGSSKLSKNKNNLKIQYYRDQINNPPSNLQQTVIDSNFLNIGVFSLSVPSDVTTPNLGVDSNGAFQFKVPKFNTDSPLGSINTPREELSIYFSPWESMQILDPDYSHIVADGLTFSYFANTELNSTLGIAYNYVNSSVARLNDQDLFMIDTSTDLKGILLDDYTYVNGNLNVLTKVSIGNVDPTSHLTVAGNMSIGDGYKAIQAPTNGAIIEGKVGMGTSAPTAKVHINNSTTDDSFLVEDATNPDTTPFVISADGNVGIGVTSPTSKIHINNNTALNSFLVEDDTNPDTTPFVINADGNVGVRIGTPLAPLHVQSASVPDIGGDVPAGLSLMLQRYNAPNQSMKFFQNGSGNQIVSYSDTTNSKSIVIHATTDQSNSPIAGTSTQVNIDFKILGNNIVRITKEQNVGIGTTSPISRLDVRGQITMKDGFEQDKAILTSDANGTASWKAFGAVGVPIGTVVAYAGSTAPAGWIECDGRPINGTIYSELRLILGGSNTPDLRGAFIIGANTVNPANPAPGQYADGRQYNLYDTGGKASVTLNDTQIPSHSHNKGTLSISSNPSSRHYHVIPYDDNTNSGFSGDGLGEGSIDRNFDSSWTFSDLTTLKPTTPGIPGDWGALLGEHGHNNASFTGNTGDTGGGGPHNNLPPYYALIYIIKYL